MSEPNCPHSGQMMEDKELLIAKAICCREGCEHIGDSEDGEKCYCDTSDYYGSGIEKKAKQVVVALSSTPSPGATAPRWRPIETEPKEDGCWLIANDRGQVCAVQSRNGQQVVHNMVGYADWDYGSKATHWQPLPASPSQEAPYNNEHIEHWKQCSQANADHARLANANLKSCLATIQANKAEIERLREALKGGAVIANLSGSALKAKDEEIARLRRQVEQLRTFADSFHLSVMDNFYKDVALHLDQPHSLSIRLTNDSSKSWLFADLEARRKAALSSTSCADEKPGENS